MKSFRVLQFNMQYGQMWDDAHPDSAPVQLDMTLAEIRRHGADILLLQEVERAQPNGEQLEPPPNYSRLRASLAGYDSWFAYPKADARELPFGIGLAIFSRTPLQDKFQVTLPSPAIEFQFEGRTTTPTDRVLIGARTIVQGHELQLLNTHLLALFMLGASSRDFPEQRNLVAGKLRDSRGPTLLGGDFNTQDHETLVTQFAGEGFSTVQQQEVTWRRHPYVLDHLFYNAPLTPKRHVVVPTPVSDHHLLIADFEFA